jgi:hypothetical protein
MASSVLLLARRGAKISKADYDARVADELEDQRSQQSTSVILLRRVASTGKYEGETIYKDKVQGDFYGIRPPIMHRRYGFSRQQGSQFGFFTDA